MQVVNKLVCRQRSGYAFHDTRFISGRGTNFFHSYSMIFYNFAREFQDDFFKYAMMVCSFQIFTHSLFIMSIRKILSHSMMQEICTCKMLLNINQT